MSFSSVTIEGKKAAPDRIYYNGTVINNTLTSVKQSDDPVVVFQDQRQTPLVPDASNYEVSVQNFSLNGCPKTLPLFIPQISPPLHSTSVTKAVLATVTLNPDDTPKDQTITYTASTTLFVGNYVNNITGFINDFFNIKTPTKIIAVDTVNSTFTIAASNIQHAPFFENSSFATLTYYDATDVTTTIYSVSVGVYTGSTYKIQTEYITWVPENQASYTIVPVTANPTQIESDYYYCYTYSHWVSLVNIALNKAWAAIGGGSSFGTQCPFIEFDETTGLFSINQDSNTCMTPYKISSQSGAASLPAPYSTATNYGASNPAGVNYGDGEYSFVGMNTCLENLLTNFPSTYFASIRPWYASSPPSFLPESVIDMGLPISLLTGIAGVDTPVGVSLRTQPKTSIFQLINPFTGTAIAKAFFARLPQDFSSTGSIWSPIASFVLVTSQIPVRNEASANPVTFGSKNVGGETGNGGAFQKVLIETPINALSADIWKGWVLYEPLTLTYSSLDPSHHGITDVDVTLFWRNRLTNSLVPVHIPNQGSMSFRLLFKKKLVL